jgi:hypothetical protein
MQIRNSSDVHTADYQSPFVGATAHRTTKIPDFSKYRVPAGTARKNQVFSYFMVGTLGALSAAGAKATVQGEDLYPPHPYTTDIYPLSSEEGDDGNIRQRVGRRGTMHG